LQLGQGCFAFMEGYGQRAEARIVAKWREVKALAKGAFLWIASRFSIAVESGNDLWSVWWGIRLDLGSYSIYLGAGKDK